MSAVFKWANRTIFSATWWKEHWWVPFVFLGAAFVWMFTKGRSNPVRKVSDRIERIRQEERTKVDQVRTGLESTKIKIDKETKKKIERAVKETKRMMQESEEDNEKYKELIEDNSDAINRALNDVVDGSKE